MKNVEFARQLVRSLAAAGVNEIILCAGARNAPLVAVLSQVSGIKVHGFFEERSAGFFAIGRMQSSRRPVAVCTTSGTAVAELLPAVVEAYYQSLPLIVLSADRPRRYRGSGAPQAIVQPGIFSSYVERSWDVDTSEAVPEVKAGRGPLHLNVCFDEPLIEESVLPWQVTAAVLPVRDLGPAPACAIPLRKPLVIAGGMSVEEAALVKPLLERWGRPVYAEGLSHLRGHLGALEIRGGEESFKNMRFDGVIRVGQVPTLRFWRDLESTALPVWHFSSVSFSGLPRHKEVLPLASLSGARVEFEAWSPAESAMDRKRFETLDGLLGEFPLSECAWVRRFSAWCAPGSRILLGNSLPIREWDLAAARGLTFKMFGNRGTNGIDGLISTFIGAAETGTSNWALIGDLSALYDLSGPWALRGRELRDVNLVVINNGGGKIFERVFKNLNKNALFENSHDINFRSWAAMWGWDYELLQAASDDPKPNGRPAVIEIVPDAAHTRAFNEAWEKFKC